MLKIILPVSLIASSFFMLNVSALTPIPAKSKVSKKVSTLTTTKVVTKKPIKTKGKPSKEASSNDDSKAGNFGITAKVSTLGLGLDLTYGIMDKLNARFNINGGSLSADGEQDGINYKGNLNLQSIGGLLDFHPTGGGFRLSAGIFNNSNEVDLDSSSVNEDAKIGDISYDISAAKVNTNVSFKSSAPYLGIGWGNAVDKKSKFSINTDLGVLFQGTPIIKMKATGNVIPKSGANTGPSVDLEGSSLAAQEFQRELLKEQEKLNNDSNLEKLKLFPVISLGLNYRF
jgi:hypothetical protein